jgi:sialic acid synthase SpsE
LFTTELGSDFDCNLNKVKDLIYAAKESGADVAKFQHHTVDSLVSDISFKNLKINYSHQKNGKALFMI